MLAAWKATGPGWQTRMAELLSKRVGIVWLVLSQLAVLPIYHLIMGLPLFETARLLREFGALPA